MERSHFKVQNMTSHKAFRTVANTRMNTQVPKGTSQGGQEVLNVVSGVYDG